MLNNLEIDLRAAVRLAETAETNEALDHAVEELECIVDRIWALPDGGDDVARLKAIASVPAATMYGSYPTEDQAAAEPWEQANRCALEYLRKQFFPEAVL